MNAITIDCDECAMQHTAACPECVVTFLCDRSGDSPVVLRVGEMRTLRMLADAGLAPALHHRPVGVAGSP